jgi:ABC-type multidrug transport system ATPase subunit
MHDGRLVAEGSVSELKQVFAGRAILEVACPRFIEAQERLEAERFVLEVSVFATRLHVVVADAEDGRRRILEMLEASGNGPASVERIVPSLEDVFIHTVERETQAGAAGGSA